MIEPKSRIKNIKLYAENEETDWRLKLDRNENIYGASKFAVSSLKNSLPEQMSLYPVYNQHKEKFAQIYNLNQNKILFTSGIDTALGLIINTYLDIEDKVLSNNPSFEKLASYTLCIGGSIEYTEFDENFEQDISKIKEQLKRGFKICYISTPNDMTGQVIRPSAITDFLREFPNTLFVVDISHLGFLENIVFNDYTDMTDSFSNVIIIKSYANDYALAGLGIGVIVSNSTNINALKILSPDYTVSAYGLNCTIAAINDTKYIEELREENALARKALCDGLVELGYKPKEADVNFILCDFGEYCEFYYNKLKNNNVIVKRFNSDSIASNCLRITVPKMGGVKFLLHQLKPRDVLIFAFEDTFVDVEKSYNEAMIRVFEHFAGNRIPFDKIKEVKRINGCDCFSAVYRLLLEGYINVDINDIKTEFKNIFHNPDEEKENDLINYDELLIREEILEQLSLNFDMVLVGLRSEEDILYSLKKFNLAKYFSYIGNAASGIAKIAEKLPHKKILSIVANEEILSMVKNAGIRSIALIAGENNNSNTINNLKHYGADDIIYENDNILKYFELSV